MNLLMSLCREAKRAAADRGHSLLGWRDTATSGAGSDQYMSRAKCRDCGMSVCVRTNPAPNETGISGEALAMDCDESRRRHPHPGW